MYSIADALKRQHWLDARAHRWSWALHRWRDWAATHVFRGSRIVDTPHGFQLMAGRAPAQRAMQGGSFETAETEIVRSLLANTDVFVDVGANIGYYVCLAGRAGVQVIAFEPQPQNLSLLYANIRLNRLERIEVFPLGLGAEAGLVELFGSSGPSASILRDWAGYSPRYRQTIPIHALDDVIGERLRDRRVLVKIDVEGYEFEVLRGAGGLLRSDPRPTWLVEIFLGEYHPAGRNPHYEETFALFFDAGYRAFSADGRRIEVTRSEVSDWFRANHSPLGSANFLFEA
ncbi:MAG: FkbM family methyltransferase [Thermoanaerobaculia bacterium]|nr:MAG: FkbM family methyltransferase [Thermoanaerobaculia bacterium]